MKKIAVCLVGLLICFGSLVAQAQNIYMKVTPYAGASPTDNISPGGRPLTVDGKLIDLSNYLQVSSVQYDFEQTLNIGSQSTGAGAGKIAFHPLTITKTADQLSPPLFAAMASGTPYQFIEFLFVSAPTTSRPVVLYKVLLKLAAVKTMSVSSVACPSGCPGIAESVSFEYGGYVVFTYTQKPDGAIVPGKVAGWNRVKNISDTSPTTPIN